MNKNDYLDFDPEWESERKSSGYELKTIKKNLRRQNMILICINLILVVVLFAVALIAAAPAMEALQKEQINSEVSNIQKQQQEADALLDAQYLNPMNRTFDDTVCDFQLAMDAYLELNRFDLKSCGLYIQHTGIGTYDVDFIYSYYGSSNQTVFSNGSVKEDVIAVPLDLRANRVNKCFDAILRASYSGENVTIDQILDSYDGDMAHAREILESLPDYIRVQADIAFYENKNMQELLDFKSQIASIDKIQDPLITWVAIWSTQGYSLLGMNPFDGKLCKNSETAADLEAHFKYLLKLYSELMSEGYMIQSDTYDFSYKHMLNDVEENGVYTYGCRLEASPKALLELLSSGEVYFMDIQDAWIDVK